jgi:hypothetical protein
MPIFLFLLTVFSRFPFTSKYLYHMDSGHFALALDQYNLVLHQPHPPGYFLYVMVGRLLHLFVADVNTVLVLISILFSGLTVVAVYYLGKEMFDEGTGTCAALLALASPNFWFHGEVALTYAIDAFFSAFIGLLCWRMLQGRREYLWFSVVILAVAGGFRQNAPLFLFPLWLISVRKEPFRRIVCALALCGIVSLAWFVPMVSMTGGTGAYREAFRELWLFNTGHNSVFEKGLPYLKVNAEVLFIFFCYTLGALIPPMVLAIYAVARKGKLSIRAGRKTYFFVCWILPSLLFYLLVFISGNPGYVLILLPPLVILASRALSYLGSELQRSTGKDLRHTLTGVVIVINVGIFLFAPVPVSQAEISAHDSGVESVRQNLGTFNPATTLLFAEANALYSYRHLMVYLPDFTVYQVDVRTSHTGESRKQFGGAHGKTFISGKIFPPAGVVSFAALVEDETGRPSAVPTGLSVTKAAPQVSLVSGPIDRVCELYPQLAPFWEPGTASR